MWTIYISTYFVRIITININKVILVYSIHLLNMSLVKNPCGEKECPNTFLTIKFKVILFQVYDIPALIDLFAFPCYQLVCSLPEFP